MPLSFLYLPEQAETAFGIALDRFHHTHHDDAAALLRHAISLDAGQARFWWLLAVAESLVPQRILSSLAAICQCLRLDPDFPGAADHKERTLFAMRLASENDPLLAKYVADRPQEDGVVRQGGALFHQYDTDARGLVSAPKGKTLLINGIADENPRTSRQFLPGYGFTTCVWGWGRGDVLYAMRGVRMLVEAGNRVLLRTNTRLHRLLSSCLPGEVRCAEFCAGQAEHGTGQPRVSLLGPQDEAADYDLYQSMNECLTLAGPSVHPWLGAEPRLQERWRAELDALAPRPAFRVGLNWHGNLWPGRTCDPRAVPLDCFAPLAEVPGVQLIAVQKGLGYEQLAGVKFPVIDLGPRLDTGNDSFVDTAAVLVNLDLFVTSDTAVAHLAGALGVRTWLLLASNNASQWGQTGTSVRDYPSMRLWRLGEHGDSWETLFRAMAKELAQVSREASRC